MSRRGTGEGTGDEEEPDVAVTHAVGRAPVREHRDGHLPERGRDAAAAVDDARHRAHRLIRTRVREHTHTHTHTEEEEEEEDERDWRLVPRRKTCYWVWARANGDSNALFGMGPYSLNRGLASREKLQLCLASNHTEYHAPWWSP